MKINIYDFDGTIYNGDSSIDFYIYCLKTQITLIIYLPIQALYTFLYIFKIINKKKWKEKYFSFLKGINNIENKVELFWKAKQHKIKKWYNEKDHSNDIIISASPEFLLLSISKQLKIKKLICSKVDSKTGMFISENCYGEEKVNRLLKEISNFTVEEVYTDSKSDMPLILLAKKGYIVNKNKIIDIENQSNIKIWKCKL